MCVEKVDMGLQLGCCFGHIITLDENVSHTGTGKGIVAVIRGNTMPGRSVTIIISTITRFHPLPSPQQKEGYEERGHQQHQTFCGSGEHFLNIERRGRLFIGQNMKNFVFVDFGNSVQNFFPASVYSNFFGASSEFDFAQRQDESNKHWKGEGDKTMLISEQYINKLATSQMSLYGFSKFNVCHFGNHRRFS